LFSLQVSDVGIADSVAGATKAHATTLGEQMFRSKSGALRDAVEGRVHPIGIRTAKPCLRSHHDHVQGEHLLSPWQPSRLATYSLIRLGSRPWAAQSDYSGEA
jgi:hypothetical protein